MQSGADPFFVRTHLASPTGLPSRVRVYKRTRHKQRFQDFVNEERIPLRQTRQVEQKIKACLVTPVQVFKKHEE